jgi:uncharacterized membrane protein
VLNSDKTAEVAWWLRCVAVVTEIVAGAQNYLEVVEVAEVAVVAALLQVKLRTMDKKSRTDEYSGG